MTVLITLTLAESDTTLFDLYSNIDGFTIPFETNVSKTSLVAGYSSSLVPDYASTIRIQCKDRCSNYIDVLCKQLVYYFNLGYSDVDYSTACRISPTVYM